MTTQLILKVRINVDGLRPDPCEFNPTLAHYGNFGNDRIANKVALTSAQEKGQADVFLSEYSLPPFDELRGDETIVFSVLPETRLSGVPELDAIQQDYVTYTDQAGMMTLPLSMVLHSALENRPIKAQLADNILQESLFEEACEQAQFKAIRSQAEAEQKAMEFMAESKAGSSKGRFESIQVAVTNPAEAKRYATRLDELVKRSETDFSTPLLFGTQRFVQEMARSEEIITRDYCHMFVGKSAEYPNAMDSLMQNLHMPFYKSNLGLTLPVAFFSPRNLPRLQVPQSNINTNPLYQQTDESLHFYEQCATSALASVGLSAKGTIEAVKAQHTGKKEIVSAEYYKVIKGVVKLQQKFALSLMYKSDTRVPRPEFLPGPSAPALGTHKRKVNICSCCLSRRFSAAAAKLGETEAGGKPEESFDDLAQYNLTKSADCEDVGHLCTVVTHEILPLTSTALTPERAAKSPLLGALASVLERYDTVAIGCSVTTPYLDTSAKSGTPEVKEAKNGHVPAQMFPRVHMLALLGRGGYDVSKLGAYLDRLGPDGKTVHREVDPFEYHLPLPTVEGTGPGTPFIRPSVEVHPSIYAANVANRKVLRALPALGHPKPVTGHLNPSEYSVLARTFRPEQLPERDEAAVNLTDRIDNFYLGYFHVVSPRLFQLDSRLAHLALVDTESRSHGVEIARLMRDTPQSKSSIALVSPYLQTTDEEMHTLISVAAVIKNMQPATSMGRFQSTRAPNSVLADYSTTCLRLGHPLSDRTFAALSQFKMPKKPSAAMWSSLVDALDGHSRGVRFGNGSSNTSQEQRPVSSRMTQHLDRSDRTVFCLYAPAWQVANADMDQLGREVQELYAQGLIIDHAFWRDRVLDQCDDTITMALIVPVAPLGK